MTFVEIRKVFSRIDRVSISFKDTRTYENYNYMKDVPEDYNDTEVCGIGIVDEMFPIDEMDIGLAKGEDTKHLSIGLYSLSEELKTKPPKELLGENMQKRCIEIMLAGSDPLAESDSEKPSSRIIFEKQEELFRRLVEVKDSYSSFVMGIMTFAKKNDIAVTSEIISFINKNPGVTASEIMEFVNEMDDSIEGFIADNNINNQKKYYIPDVYADRTNTRNMDARFITLTTKQLKKIEEKKRQQNRKG